MQQKNDRRSNRERTEVMRAALMAAARTLFVEKSYGETGTPEIVAAAGVTRGALYHHFEDKRALFLAVVEAEAEAVAREVEDGSSSADKPPREALLKGGEAFLTAMAAPGRTRLLLLDGPAVLGRAAMDEIDMRHGLRTLKEGLEAAMDAGAIRRLPLDTLTLLLGAAFDRAALALEAGAARKDVTQTLKALLDGLEA